MDGLQEFETVTLTFPPMPGSARYVSADCYILAFGWHTIALEAADKRQVLRLAPTLPKVLMSFDRAKAVLAVRGHVIVGERVGDLRFVLDGGALGPPPRTNPSRVPFDGKIGVTSVGTTAEGRIRELLAVGHIIADCDASVTPGETVTLAFRLTNQEHTDIEARVLENAGGTVRLEVTGRGSVDVRSLIAGAVIEHNRSALRRMLRQHEGTRPEF